MYKLVNLPIMQLLYILFTKIRNIDNTVSKNSGLENYLEHNETISAWTHIKNQNTTDFKF